MEEVKDGLLIKGKTKEIYTSEDDPENYVICKYLDTITANNDPSLTREFDGKGRDSNTVNGIIMGLLKKAGIPVAFVDMITDTEFLAHRCQMILLEVIARRLLVGSYLKRWPNVVSGTRCHRLEIEFFLKTTDGGLKTSDGAPIVKGLTPDQDDPLIINPYDFEPWKLVHPKRPSWSNESSLEGHYNLRLSQDVFNKAGFKGKDLDDTDRVTMMERMEELTRRVFLVIEGAWKTLGLRLIDLKLEFGIAPDGTLVVADVIDCDSWRLWNDKGEDISKQSFRDMLQDEPDGLKKVRAKYAYVAEMASRIRIPKQVLVLWRGSDKDKLPKFDLAQQIGVTTEKVTLSGHKATQRVLNRLNELENQYPEGGVIICFVGRNNSLGPVLSTHTNWLVISVPVNYRDFADDIRSNTRMPSDTPNMVAWPAENAMLAAMSILGQRNPIFYAICQFRIEELDF